MLRKLVTGSLFFLLLLAGCATTVTPRPEIEGRALLEERNIQRKIALEQNIKDSSRIQDVGFPLLQAAVSFCGPNVVESIGLDVATSYDFEESFQRAAQEALATSASVTVMNAIDGGPSAVAGIQSKDTILAVNGNPIVTGANASAIFSNLLKEELDSNDSIVLSIDREGASIDFEVSSVDVCDYNISLVLTDDLNAYADGSNVYITRRMLRFTDSDKELALVIAHELAHNIMNHVRKRRQNYSLGLLVDLAARSQGIDTSGLFRDMTADAYSQAFEAEADYVGMYILARTGMDLDGAIYFWRRMAVESPSNIDSHSSSHPATAERFLALEQAIVEIAEKKAAGISLNPETKSD
ncbi:MAG: hypothetical protein COA96_08440 [SAR86 cluster bacterium]|uniref:PDZ domain-containing protein n=1 Tax=SAR86 cluster bacterium TaxID=2030880 RepID=A0A2A5AZZ6_9GAMM|nr:MAG: hypothetical protein COA96_08440 [SAR86 cluster bacterium]